jgi:1-aminocyclopropane-1-carboxylate deaminase/D-cysteine desulfhydrase-like pyridoxal-dependent ACC family enzyme
VVGRSQKDSDSSQHDHVIAPGAAVVAGAIGYGVAVRELAEQLAEIGTDADYVVTTAGSCGTQAGIEVALRLFYPRAQAIGIAIGATRDSRADLVADLTNFTADFPWHAGESCTAGHSHVRLHRRGVRDSVPAGIAAISELARKDALVLDPVYTGKAMAGVLDLARNGEFEPGARIVFLHTGGAPALCAARDHASAAGSDDEVGTQWRPQLRLERSIQRCVDACWQ